MSLTTARELIRERKVSGNNGDDLFHIRQSKRSKSEPRYSFKDEPMLSEQKRQMIKKILLLQRQKFKDNQAHKAGQSNEFENSIYAFSSVKNDDEQALFDE